MPFFLSALATASYCFCGSVIGSELPRYVIQAVPVYSYMASASPDLMASRAPIEPWMPVRSRTSAPAALNAMPMIAPSTSCSVNSLDVTVMSKEFTEQLVLGAIMGIAFKAAGADVLDRTGIQGSIGAREAIKSGDADAMYEYTGTAWITYLGNSDPITDPQKQYEAVAKADKKNGITWLPQAELNNTYALAMNNANFKKYGTRSLSDVAALAKKNPKAVTLCVESEFANRADGLP